MEDKLNKIIKKYQNANYVEVCSDCKILVEFVDLWIRSMNNCTCKLRS